jgi:hypothetical protein
LAIALRPALRDEGASKLERFEKVVAGEATAGSGFGGRGGPSKPIKSFVTARAKSVTEQLEGNSEGVALGDNGRGGPGRGGPGGGPGQMMAPMMTAFMDANRDGRVSKDEFVGAFDKWFVAWNTDKAGAAMTGDDLRAGINRDLGPHRGGMFGGGRERGGFGGRGGFDRGGPGGDGPGGPGGGAAGPGNGGPPAPRNR